MRLHGVLKLQFCLFLVLLFSLLPAVATEESGMDAAQNPAPQGTPAPTAKPAASAQPAFPIKISGYAFGDFYWVASNHDAKLENENGFWLRRAYLTVDKQLTPKIDTRFRLEVNSAGDFVSKLKLEPYVKDAWIRWKYAGDHRLVFGISPTPTWEVIEGFWGYRSVEKTMLDLQRMGDSRDFGLALQGSLDKGQKVRYHFMVSNGNGTSSEVGAGKKTLLSLAFYPSKSIIFELYGDYEDQPNNAHRRTGQAFLGYKTDRGRIGVQFAHQTFNRPAQPTVDLDTLSVFGSYRASSLVSLYGRYDGMFDPNPGGPQIPYIPFDPNAKSNLFIGGIDLRVTESFSVMPNVEVVYYGKLANGTRPGTDCIPRVTLFYNF